MEKRVDGHVRNEAQQGQGSPTEDIGLGQLQGCGDTRYGLLLEQVPAKDVVFGRLHRLQVGGKRGTCGPGQRGEVPGEQGRGDRETMAELVELVGGVDEVWVGRRLHVRVSERAEGGQARGD